MRQFICDILSKIASGRYILTLVCAIAFLLGTINKVIPVDAVVSIITMVFISYFQRQDRGNQKGGQA